MRRNLDDPRPEYVQIAEDLRTQVASGRLKPGDKLPARPKLADEYGVAVATVGRAIEELSREGVLVAWQRGTFVREVPSPDKEGHSPEYEAVMEQLLALRDDLRDLDGRVSRLEKLADRADPRNA